MTKKDENMEWEREAPLLASLSSTTPYRVPDNYFEDLQSRINQSVFVAGLNQQEIPGFSVPENYFEALNQQIQSRIFVEELQRETTEDGFQTPPNYFERLQSEILSKTTAAAPTTKIVRLWHTDLMKYAAAACFIVLTASGLYLNQQNTVQQIRNTELASEQVLYDIDESVIIEHLQESQTATTTSASATEMESYILDNFSSNDLSNL